MDLEEIIYLYICILHRYIGKVMWLIHIVGYIYITSLQSKLPFSLIPHVNFDSKALVNDSPIFYCTLFANKISTLFLEIGLFQAYIFGYYKIPISRTYHNFNQIKDKYPRLSEHVFFGSSISF